MPRRRALERVPAAPAGSEDDDLDDDDSSERPQQRNAANARERARMRVLSRAFCRLKTTLPWVPPDTKLSKLDTLRLATSYIAHLRAVLCLDDEGDEETARNTVHPLNLTWPFSFQQGPTGGAPSPWELSPPPHAPHTRHGPSCSPPPEPPAYQHQHPYSQTYSDTLLQIG